MYLLRLRHSMDDVPFFLTADREEAIERARTASWDVPEHIALAANIPDCSTPCNIDVLQFENKEPLRVIFRREYEDEEDDRPGPGEILYPPEVEPAPKQLICYRVRYRHPQDGRMWTMFVPMDSDARIIETPPIKYHYPEWIGQNFVTMSHKWYREFTELTCSLVDPAIIGTDADPTEAETSTDE